MCRTAVFPCTRWPTAASRRSAAGRAPVPSETATTHAPVVGRAPTRSSAACPRRLRPPITASSLDPVARDTSSPHTGRVHRQLSHLEALEAESIHIIREVAAECERPVLLFSGGKDSAVMLRLAEKAFSPAPIPFPVMHVDTGHNFPEALDFRDRRIAELGVRLVVASVPDAIAAGRVVEDRPGASRNRLQTTVLLEAIAEHRFDAVFGGGRRDEEKARAKERVFSHRDEFGQWDPKNQRPELWSLYNGRRRAPVDLLRAPPRGLPPGRDAHGRRALPASRGRRRGVSDHGAVPDRRRHELHRRRRVDRGDAGGDRRRDRGVADHRARCDPSRRPLLVSIHGRPKARGLLLDEALMELLRLATAGSVDDGKSTLIGRLLYDSKQIFKDQLEAVERTSRERGDEYTDLALLTDGLRAEREQGITIDVAYRYFATPKRKFII